MHGSQRNFRDGVLYKGVKMLQQSSQFTIGQLSELPPTIEELQSLEQLLAKKGVSAVSEDYAEIFETSERMFRLPNGSVMVFRHDDLRKLGANDKVANVPLDRFMQLTYSGPTDNPIKPHEMDQIRRFQAQQFFSPEHSHQHKVMKPLFSKPLFPKEIPPYQAIATELTHKLIAKHSDGSEFDLVADFGCRLGYDFWGEVFGMSGEEVLAIEQIMVGMAPVAVPGARGRESLVKLNKTIPEYFDVLTTAMKRCRTERGHKILGWIVEEFGNPEKNLGLLSEGPEIFMAANMIDGLHAMGIGISTALYHLAANPGVFRALKENPDLSEVAVNEALRLNSPVAAIHRHVSEDVEYDGLMLPKGTIVMLHWAAGNQDPAVHHDPHKFDIYRPQKPLTTFGAGVQLCPGRNLARALASQVVREMANAGVEPEIRGHERWIENRMTISRQYPSYVPVRLKV